MDAATIFSLITIFLVLFVCIKNRSKQRGVAELPPPSEAVRSILEKDGKIAAIRDYRRQTHASLFEASKVIEHYQAQLYRNSA